MKSKGYILYTGPSVLDGAPIAVIATMASNNVKTGPKGVRNMIQTWIIRTDIAPHIAARDGLDSSVCGDCIHKPTNGGTCYVTLFQAPLQVYKGYHSGIYSHDLGAFEKALEGRTLRIGAYGDGAAAPADMWLKYAAIALGHTGYTHQIDHPNFDRRLLDVLMVSIDTEKQALSVPTGSRYFRVKAPLDPVLAGEVECLSDSVGKTCAECLLCDGAQRGKGKNVYITVHGSRASKFNPSDIIAIAA